MSQIDEIDELPDPPADAWAWELFEDALVRLANARAAYDDLLAEDPPIALRAQARFELEDLRTDIALLRNLVLTRPR